MRKCFLLRGIESMYPCNSSSLCHCLLTGILLGMNGLLCTAVWCCVQPDNHFLISVPRRKVHKSFHSSPLCMLHRAEGTSRKRSCSSPHGAPDWWDWMMSVCKEMGMIPDPPQLILAPHARTDGVYPAPSGHQEAGAQLDVHQREMDTAGCPDPHPAPIY